MHRKMQFLPESFEQGDVSAAFVAEREVRANADALEHRTPARSVLATADPLRPGEPRAAVSQVADKVADELFPRLGAEGAVEVNQEQRFSSQGFKGANSLRQGINQGRHAVRGDDGVGVLVEGEDQRKGIMLPRVRERLADDLLMAEVHAVEEADGEADFAVAGLKLGC